VRTPETGHERSGALVCGAGVALVCLAAPGEAQAYLDAGTGSMLLQVIIASAAGTLIAIRVYWARIKARFFGGPPVEARKASPPEPEDEPR
jgi:hypothetical protein